MNPEQKELKIIVVDDNLVFRKVTRSFLENEYQYRILGEASCAREFFSLPLIHQADVILMDLQMPEKDGCHITKELLREYSYLKVIAITMHTDKAYLNELIKIGFKGCVFKPDFYRDIRNAILTVSNNRYFFPKEIQL